MPLTNDEKWLAITLCRSDLTDRMWSTAWFYAVERYGETHAFHLEHLGQRWRRRFHRRTTP